MTDQHAPIYEAVQARYAAIATGQHTSVGCCGGSGCGCGDSTAAVQLYDEALLDGLPVDVTGLSLGCGDPVTIASLQPGEIVLDLGSGGGIDCFLAARQVGPTGTVIGVDMTPAMLVTANANRDKLGLQNVEFRQGHIEELPVDDNSVDVVMSNCVINLSPRKPAVFAEVLRVLKPGGRVVLSDIVTQGDFSDALRANLNQWAECVTGAIDAETYLALMLEAGFVEVTLVDKTPAEDVIAPQPGMPRIFSARITAQKASA